MSVKVIRERSDQRRHHRVTAPLFVEFDGHRVKATDWSLGGLRIDAFPGTLPDVGASVTLGISIPFQGFDVNFKCQAEVVRRLQDSKTFAVRYTEIGDRELGLMEHFIDELIRGSMVDVRETIQRIDVPVTPASTKPDPNPLAKVPISRWPTRTIAYAALYLTIGLFVFGYAAVIAYTNFVRMEVDSAVIASPIESVRSQVNGRISYGKYRPGDQVPKGALLLSVVDNDLERQIDLATIDIKDKTAQLAASERQLLEELARVDAFSKVESKNLDQLTLEIQSLDAQAKAATALHRRLDHLFKQGLTTATQVENAEKQMIAAQKLAQAKSVELQTRQSLATYNAGSRLYNGQGFMGERAKVEAQAMLARDHVGIAERKLQALLDHRDRLAVYAPYAGMLQELPRPDGSMVRLGDVIAVVENPRSREIWAFLRQDEVLSVGLGDEVKIYLPGLSELRQARVLRIDRTIGFVNEMNATYVWRAPRDRSAKVILEFIDKGTRPENDSYRTGMPAVAIFSTRPTNYLIGDMMHRFRMVFGGRPRKPAEEVAAKPQPAKEVAQGDVTLGTTSKDRIGPPRSYEATRDPIRDPDAVTARRANQATQLTSAPSVSPAKPTSAEPSPASTGGIGARISETVGIARELLGGLFHKPAPARETAAATDVSKAPAAPTQPATSVPASRKVEPPPASRAILPDASMVAAHPPAPRPPIGAMPSAGSRHEADAPVEPEAKPSASIAARPTIDPIEKRPHAMRPTLPPPDDEENFGTDDDGDPPALRKASAPGKPVSAGFFTRLRERLKALLAPIPDPIDDDWGDEEDFLQTEGAPIAVEGTTTPRHKEGDIAAPPRPAPVTPRILPRPGERRPTSAHVDKTAQHAARVVENAR